MCLQLSLSLCSIQPPVLVSLAQVVGEELLAEFLLHCLVHAPPPQKRRYMKELRLKDPPTDLEDVRDCSHDSMMPRL